ncbi:hypothetical protein [Actinophytocola sp.]|uniref:hypothetical protein n=1 Tax=Actinophytocola sp. TaxID=1872138 RepID=UPI00389ACFB1
MRRILVVALAVVAAALSTATPASAGNWEETLLDPPPARVEAGVTYTFGYWILQHGSYPYQGGDLGPTALRATDENGTAVEFPGVAAATAGHYSAEVLFPHDGKWIIGSQHEVLMTDPLVAEVTVPGPVWIAPSQMKERAPYAWGAAHPSFPPAAADADTAAPGGYPTSQPAQARNVATRGHETAEAPGTRLPVWLVIVGGAVTVGFAFLLVRRYRRVNR